LTTAPAGRAWQQQTCKFKGIYKSGYFSKNISDLICSNSGVFLSQVCLDTAELKNFIN
jgi:hypothetical protein